VSTANPYSFFCGDCTASAGAVLCMFQTINRGQQVLTASACSVNVANYCTRLSSIS